MRSVRLFVAGLFVMLIGSTAWAAACDGFTDVDSGASYCTAVIYLKDHGITLGCTGTTYCPDAFVTRAQMALFLQRAAQADPTNVLGDHTSAIAGGANNTANAQASFVGGGQANNATGIYSTVAGGGGNTASGGTSIVAGGGGNFASGGYAFIGGGEFNVASGAKSTIAGGYGNTASGAFSFAAGLGANAIHDGCFVWGDSSTDNPVSCIAPNQFFVRSVGGIYMLTGGTDQASYIGVALGPGGGAWINLSDRNGKEEFADVDPDAVLRKVVALPISTWQWKSQAGSIRHMGPMAQDFSAAFGLGETPKGINTVDADGVALAAIQGLNAKLETDQALIVQQSRALAEQAYELAEIKAQLAVLVAAH